MFKNASRFRQHQTERDLDQDPVRRIQERQERKKQAQRQRQAVPQWVIKRERQRQAGRKKNPIRGRVHRQVKGGWLVSIQGFDQAFCPNSLMRWSSTFEDPIGAEFPFEVVELTRTRLVLRRIL